ncbi:MAG TPA: response regulator transcription factor [Anaerolineales bacterium]|nr:response regulator transcription factor [Anaerolineales bacterium]
MDQIRLVIVDDHPVVRDGLRGMLESQPDFEIVGEASDGSAAVRLAESLVPDIVLMDLRMPVMDGVTALGEIKTHNPQVQVLVLTTYDSDADILPAIEAGASGYLLKDSSRGELFAGIRAAARGETVLAPAVAARLVGRMRAPGEEQLSSREVEVLQLVAEGESNSEIASHLHISQATVKSHLVHIFGKLGVSDRTAAVTAALRRGILRLGQ